MTVRRLARVLVALVPIGLAGCTGLSGDYGVAAGPDVEAAAYERGKAHFLAGHFGLAVKHFQLAADRDPRSVEALNGLAAAYDRLGRFDLSARYYQRALTVEPDSAQTLNNIGYSYLLQDRRDLAVAYLRDAQARAQGDPTVAANRQAAETALAQADVARAAPRPAPAAPEPVVATPLPAPEAAVRPWIERTAPNVQSLVTAPQFALWQADGLDPSLVGYRPVGPEGAAELPDYLAAPMADPQNRPARPAVDVARAPGRTAVARLVTEPVERTPLPPPGPEAGAVVEVSNGTGRLRMAARVGAFLDGKGLVVARLSNADHFSHLETTIFYREGWKRLAQRLADLFPAEVTLKGQDDQEADIRIELGGDLLGFDRDLYYAGARRSVDAATPG